MTLLMFPVHRCCYFRFISAYRMFTRIWITLFLAFLSYTVWIYAYCDNKIVYPDNTVMNGWQTWQDKNCQSCHQLYGLGGYMGPDLTNVAKTKSERHIRTYIKYGTGRMPNFHLSDTETENLQAFLLWVNKTGTATVPPEAVHWSGSYIIDEKR